MSFKNEKRYLLGLHSSSEKFGVGIIDLKNPQEKIQIASFDGGRELSNNLFDYVDSILPTKSWMEIARIAVSKGPGSFTGTRVSVAMARTLAQQINCPLEGVSSFALMAARHAKSLENHKINSFFWIKKVLPRHGVIAGKYKVINPAKENNKLDIIELEEPHLIPDGTEISPSLNASDNILEDIRKLLEILAQSHSIKNENHWSEVLPIYPISPISNSK
ncbi:MULTISPECIES: tRNA (adenosine(37)-N6)-threonylcarbamoyltransferase complex dimerization subunit type 1 TsaB [Prochlorococcus]|uniref:tRNA (adenosine(37)-N6)-threonylcarbamoyltransferase complex dimerization subunit type 1 TsaB n=1 Tax=Prochlorococcus TaxID=1218 RepID=UPI0005339223|nr:MULTISPECIES: tRNA (adenosine(37)-N6)-threonylcarbamoyltransferase complex dimerization subunit type 1 TsaB [Prochlorococcus]KGG13236.1 inactive metal-dependent protease [Prochlorococcus sp. MIT 0601]